MSNMESYVQESEDAGSAWQEEPPSPALAGRHGCWRMDTQPRGSGVGRPARACRSKTGSGPCMGEQATRR